jgi:hypothetical protein
VGAGDLINGPWQIELNGVLMGVLSPANPCPDLVVTKWPKLGVPASRQNDIPKSMDHGSFPGPNYATERDVLVSVLARGSTPALLRAALARLAGAFAPIPDTTPGLVVPMVLTFDDASHLFQLFGNPRRADFVYDNVLTSGQPYASADGVTGGDAYGPFSDEMVCEFMATDPRFYDYVAQQITIGLGTQSGGFGFPFGFPFGFGTALPGQAYIVNNGNAVTYPTLLFTAGGAGLSGIVVNKPNTGESWSINLAMNPGDTLLVDMNAHTALLNGTADRSSFVLMPPSVWWGIEPVTALLPSGVLMNFVGSGAGSTCQVTWSSAWWL